MSDTFALHPDADDQKMLAQVVGFYHATLKATPTAIDYLRGRGITSPEVIDAFRIGYSDRSLGLKLPSKQNKTGAAIRERLQRLGVLRESGHEHFRGSVTFPILAGDGSGRIVDIYGRKTRDDLRIGTPSHTHLNDGKEGVWNIEAFAASDEIVLCGSLWDALTFWSHGYRNVTTMFGPDALTDDLLAAFEEFNVKRVLTPCQAVVEELLGHGLEVFVFNLPLNVDVNAYARQVDNPADALGSLLRGAGWEGNGRVVPLPSSSLLDEDDEAEAVLGELLDADDDLDEVEVQPEADPVTQPTPERIASPLPKPPEQVEADVGDDEVTVTFGNRRYRVRGMAKNATLDVLRVNVLVSTEQAMHVDTFDLYSARHRKAFQEAAAAELSIEEAVIKRDLGRVLLKLEEVQDAHRQASQPTKEVKPEMTGTDREAALALLRDPNLLDRIVTDFNVVGEGTNKLVGYLAAVNRLSAEVLGRSLDELPPQTRRLLDLIDGMVGECCRRQGVDRADFRFTQRDVREASGWGNTQLKIHLKRLVEMEFLLVHRDRQAKRFVYELAYAKPAEAGGKVLAGLLNVEEL